MFNFVSTNFLSNKIWKQRKQMCIELNDNKYTTLCSDCEYYIHCQRHTKRIENDTKCRHKQTFLLILFLNSRITNNLQNII